MKLGSRGWLLDLYHDGRTADAGTICRDHLGHDSMPAWATDRPRDRRRRPFFRPDDLVVNLELDVRRRTACFRREREAASIAHAGIRRRLQEAHRQPGWIYHDPDAFLLLRTARQGNQ